MKPKTPCRQPGCAALVDKPGYCDRHKRPAAQAYNRARADSAEQGVYNSSRWQKLRHLKRSEDPFCERCNKAGRIKPADMVHHKLPIKDGGDPWAWDNLESVCNSCQAELHRGRG